MQLPFTKMHGAGNDFIVVDATAGAITLSPQRWRALADRHFGVGADQILIVGKPRDPANDFSYRIINADGGEVEHCGNGARAFLRYVIDKKLTDKRTVRVEIVGGTITLDMRGDGQVTVDMGSPKFDPADVPFRAVGLTPRREGALDIYDLPISQTPVAVSVVSMGNPHAVQWVDDVDRAPVDVLGPRIETDAHFPQRVNVGFVQRLDSHHIRLRVWERGAGETLACGTGACAAVAVGIAQGRLASPVTVDVRGGRLEIAWAGTQTSMQLTGPAVKVFEGVVEV